MEPSSDPQEEEMMQGGQMVNCPVCNVSIVMGAINTHLDSGCQKKPLNASGATTSGAKDQWSKLFLKKGKSKDNGIDVDDATERIPKASYDVLKDKQVKDLLQAHNLPILGDRKTWIARHQRWVMIFNANLDKSQSNRKTTKELRNELKNWEDNRKRRHLVDNTATHMLNNQGEFARLIAEARNSKTRKDFDRTIVRQHPQDDDVVADSEEDQSLS
jgi:E3 ubiquitin-protein ligase RAD18